MDSIEVLQHRQKKVFLSIGGILLTIWALRIVGVAVMFSSLFLTGVVSSSYWAILAGFMLFVSSIPLRIPLENQARIADNLHEELVTVGAESLLDEPFGRMK
jgi:hypothetical protein